MKRMRQKSFDREIAKFGRRDFIKGVAAGATTGIVFDSLPQAPAAEPVIRAPRAQALKPGPVRRFVGVQIGCAYQEVNLPALLKS